MTRQAHFRPRECARCETSVTPTSGAQRYCPECAYTVRREAANRLRREKRAANPQPVKTYNIVCADCRTDASVPSPLRQRCDECRKVHDRDRAKGYARTHRKEAEPATPITIECVDCHDSVEAQNRSRTLCEECAAERGRVRSRTAGRARTKANGGPFVVTCQECKKKHEAYRRNVRFCTPCREDRAAQQRHEYAKRPDVAAQIRLVAKERRYSRRHELATKYDLTLDEFEAMIAERQGRCDICLRVPKDTLCVDHAHTTGVVRGLLCRRCNAALGLFKDSPDVIEQAIAYLLANGGL